MTPDVCRTPNGPAMPPIPYSVWAKQNDSAAATAAPERQTGMTSHTSASLITVTHGDAPGVGGGVKSRTVGSICQPKTWSKTVRFEGKNAVRHDDEWWMNRKNCHGQLTYLKDTKVYDPTPDAKETSALTSKAVEEAASALKGADLDAIPDTHLAQVGAFLKAIKGIRRPPPPPPIPPIIRPHPDGAPVSRPGASETLTTETSRTSKKEEEERDNCPCKIGKYSELVKECPNCGSNYQAHHIIPDYTLRYGTRAQGVTGGSRIPGVPTFQNGPSICLKGSASMSDAEHYEAHLADEMIKREALKVDLGRPVGSVEFRLVRFHSVDAVKSIVQGKDPACASKIDALVDEAFKDVPYNKLLRGLKILPVPPALDALRQGALYPWKPVP